MGYTYLWLLINTHLSHKLLILKLVLSDINMSTSDLYDIFSWRIALQLLTLSIWLFWFFRCFSWRQKNFGFNFKFCHSLLFIGAVSQLLKRTIMIIRFVSFWVRSLVCLWGLPYLKVYYLSLLLKLVLSLKNFWIVVYPWSLFTCCGGTVLLKDLCSCGTKHNSHDFSKLSDIDWFISK